MDNAAEKLSALEARYMRLKELSDTANGDIADKAKIKLETYIQALISTASLREPPCGYCKCPICSLSLSVQSLSLFNHQQSWWLSI